MVVGCFGGPLMQRRMWCHLGSSRSGPSRPFLLCVPMCRSMHCCPGVFWGAPRMLHSPHGRGSLHPGSAPGAVGGLGQSAGQAEASGVRWLLLQTCSCSVCRRPHPQTPSRLLMVPGAHDFDASKFTVIFTLFDFNVLFRKFFPGLGQRVFCLRVLC